MAFADPAQNIQYFGFSPEMKVADLGSGAGVYSLLLARRLETGKVYAVEVQKGLLEKLATEAEHHQLNNLEVIWGDAEKLGGTKLKDGSVDGVLISNLLFQAKAGYTIALEAARILKPGGLLVVIDWSGSFSGLGPHPDDIITSEQAEKIFSEAGFKKINQFPAGPHHWGLRFKKGS